MADAHPEPDRGCWHIGRVGVDDIDAGCIRARCKTVGQVSGYLDGCRSKRANVDPKALQR